MFLKQKEFKKLLDTITDLNTVMKNQNTTIKELKLVVDNLAAKILEQQEQITNLKQAPISSCISA